MLNNLASLKTYETVSVSPENITGEKGKGGATPLENGTAKNAARDLGTGWKVNPFYPIKKDETLVLADVKDEGEITQIWLTPTNGWRGFIIRFYWDGAETPAIECPLGDFFANGLNEYAPVNSLPICVNPGCAFNCYWTMPFRKGFKVTLQNRNHEDGCIYYQINYLRKPVAQNAGYFHAQFRRQNPLPYMENFTMLDNIQGQGAFVGTYMTWGVNNSGWWGEGEVKMFIDGDQEYPSICYTGTEDYFGGSYNFENQKTHQYEEYTNAYCGMPQVQRPDGVYRSQMRFGLYRFHITDPIYFQKDFKATIQALGWHSGGRYLPLQDDLSCVSFFYLDKPETNLPRLLTPDEMEIN